MAGIDDIIKLSGVSRSTVFRFMNGSNVRSEAKKAIIQAMERLNYKTDAIIKQQNVSIEISISNNFEGFKGFTEVVQGIIQRADERGVRVNLATRSKDQITEHYTRWNKDEGLKGVIVVGKNKEDEDKEAEMLKAGSIPHVFVNRIMNDPYISYVSVDLKQAAYDIVRYLIDCGHSKIAVIGSPKVFRVDSDKLEGYKLAFHDTDTKVPQGFYIEIEDPDDWESNIRNMFESNNIPSAFFAICDSQAMKFAHLAQSYGYRVPEDISVVGMDDVEAAAYFKPALTTVHVPFRKMGLTAVDNLLQMITNDEVSNIRTIIRHKLVIRESARKSIHEFK